jgi:major vault protein
MASIIRIKPFQYIHVLDNNANVTFVDVGPKTFTRQDHQKIVHGPEDMIMVPPRHYCVVSNPVEKKADGSPVTDEHGNAKLRYGDEEIRFEQEPFPLYPGEKVTGKITPLQIIAPNTALRLRALRDFTVGSGKEKVSRVAGEEWLFRGPGTYIPRVDETVVELIKATVIKPNTAQGQSPKGLH